MRFCLFFIVFLGFFDAHSQHRYWSDPSTEERWQQQFLTFQLDLEALQSGVLDKRNKAIWLPLPNGQFETFDLSPSKTLSEGLQLKYPHLNCFIGRSRDSQSIVYVGWSKDRFHAMGRSEKGTFHIDRIDKETYRTYYHRDYIGKSKSNCLTKTGQLRQRVAKRTRQGGEDVEMRNYRLAVATTGEYAAYHGSSKSEVMDAIVATINKINLIYNNDLAINLELVSNTDDVIFLDADTDPFTEGNANAMISQCQGELDATIGVPNYDIGHVLGRSNAGGLANQWAVCINGLKGRGYSATTAPNGDAFDVDYVAHEIGHQFGASHTWNHCSGGSDAPNKDVEPGSGSTIMGYAGLCGTSNLQMNTDPYFHSITIEEINEFIDTDIPTCHTTSGVVNTNPTASIRAGGFFIPIQTPFELIAAATDLEDFNLTYTWEQIDNGPSVPLGQAQGESPLFRSYEPSPNPVRVFPRLEVLLNNISNDKEETLPDYTRNLNFRLTVRDNNPDAGGVDYEDIRFRADESAGPFSVLTPNSSSTVWEEFQSYEVTWDVANTDQAPINCAKVDIYLSRDGGMTFTELLLDDAPNNGSAMITLPEGVTTQARIKVKGADNIFFDISNQNFEIDRGTSITSPENLKPSVLLYPNPSQGLTTIQFENVDTQMIQVQVFNVAGRLLLTEETSTDTDYELTTNHYANGIYWVRLKSKYLNFAKKLVINNL